MSDFLDKKNEMCDYFADLIRSPARSIKVYKHMKFCDRINSLKIEKIEKEKKLTCAQLDHEIFMFLKKTKN